MKNEDKILKKLMGKYENRFKRLVKVIYGEYFGDEIKLMSAKMDMTNKVESVSKAIAMLDKIHNFDGKLVAKELVKLKEEGKITSVSFGRENYPILYVFAENSDVFMCQNHDQSETLKALHRLKPDRIEIWTETYFKLIWD